jgi:hypothetical protein
VSENKAPQNGDLSPEEAERLSERLKPSWELDDAPFSVPMNPVQISAPIAPPPADLAAGVVSAPVPVPNPAAANVPGAPVIPGGRTSPSAPPVTTPAGTAATRAAAKAKHARTVMGLAPPSPSGSSAPPGAAPNTYAIAVPATPLSPATPITADGALPSVVLAEPAGRLPVNPAPAAFQLGQPQNLGLDLDDDDDLPIRRSKKGPFLVGLILATAGGIGGYALLSPSKPAPPPAPIATVAPAPEPAPVVTAPPPPSPPIEPAVTAAAIPVSPPPPAAQPSPPPEPPRSREPKPNPLTPPTEENTAASKSRETSSTGLRAAPPAAPKPAVPRPAAVKPASPSKPSGGIVRDVPF